jgi:trans-aconitate methyltransferase
VFGDAAAYDRFMGRWSQRLAPAFLDAVTEPEPSAVLDVGCGTGNLSMAAAGRWPSATVRGVDPSAAFVRAARERAVATRVSFEVGDAQNLPLPAGIVDVSLACLVLNFVPEPAGAVAEMCRVTRPGGTVAACVWDYADGMVMLHEMWDAAASVGLDAGDLDERRAPLGHRGALAGLLRDAGLRVVTDGAVVVEAGFSSFDDYWQPFLGGQGAGGRFVATLTEAERAVLRAELQRRLGAGPFDLPLRAWAAAATVPASVPSTAV